MAAEDIIIRLSKISRQTWDLVSPNTYTICEKSIIPFIFLKNHLSGFDMSDAPPPPMGPGGPPPPGMYNGPPPPMGGPHGLEDMDQFIDDPQFNAPPGFLSGGQPFNM